MVAIFVVLTIILFICLDILVLKYSDRKKSAKENNYIPIVERFRVPKGVFFYPGHTWASILPSGKVNIGIDDFAIQLVGKIDEIKGLKPGDRIYQGKSVVKIRQGTRLMDFLSPIDGIITQINQENINNPNNLQKSPYKAGWIFQVEPSQFANNLTRLMIAEKSMAWFKSELSRFRDFIQTLSISNSPIGQTLMDGGLPVKGVLEHMDDGIWTKFENNFLRR